MRYQINRSTELDLPVKVEMQLGINSLAQFVAADKTHTLFTKTHKTLPNSVACSLCTIIIANQCAMCDMFDMCDVCVYSGCAVCTACVQRVYSVCTACVQCVYSNRQNTYSSLKFQTLPYE